MANFLCSSVLVMIVFVGQASSRPDLCFTRTANNVHYNAQVGFCYGTLILTEKFVKFTFNDMGGNRRFEYYPLEVSLADKHFNARFRTTPDVMLMGYPDQPDILRAFFPVVGDINEQRLKVRSPVEATSSDGFGGPFDFKPTGDGKFFFEVAFNLSKPIDFFMGTFYNADIIIH